MSKTKNGQAQRSKTEPVEIVKMELEVIEGLPVEVIPDKEHEFLMTVGEVARGYKTSKGSIFQALRGHKDELIEGKHFARGVYKIYTPISERCDISHASTSRCVLQPNSILLTKRGIVRLGFFIKHGCTEYLH
jgi:hypothetical protein